MITTNTLGVLLVLTCLVVGIAIGIRQARRGR